MKNRTIFLTVVVLLSAGPASESAFAQKGTDTLSARFGSTYEELSEFGDSNPNWIETELRETSPEKRQQLLIQLERALTLNEVMLLAGLRFENGYADLIFGSDRAKHWYTELMAEEKHVAKTVMKKASDFSNLATAAASAQRIQFCWKVAQMPEKRWLDLMGEFLVFANRKEN